MCFGEFAMLAATKLHMALTKVTNLQPKLG